MATPIGELAPDLLEEMYNYIDKFDLIDKK